MDHFLHNPVVFQLSPDSLHKLKSVLDQFNLPIIPSDKESYLETQHSKKEKNATEITPNDMITSSEEKENNLDLTSNEDVKDELDLESDEEVKEDLDLESDEEVKENEQVHKDGHHLESDQEDKEETLDLVSEDEKDASSKTEQTPCKSSLLPVDFRSNLQKIFQDVTSKTKIQKENKITLNVGGKRFNLRKSLLDKFNINFNKLQKTIKDDGRVIYFLDKDPYYFSKMISLVKMYGFDCNKISSGINNYSEQLISELCVYGLLDQKFAPRPKLKLKRIVTFPSRHDDIIKLVVDKQLFETSAHVLSRSNFFDTKLKLSRSKQFHLAEIDPKIFRYVLNFLRIGELYVNNEEIIKLLHKYGIEYDYLENKKIVDDLVSYYLPHTLEAINQQLLNYPKFSESTPENCLCENLNVITTESKLRFSSEIIFNLTNKDLGEYIEDLVLCIDIPIIKPTEHVEYVDFLEYRLVSQIAIIYDDKVQQKLLLQTNSDAIYLYPVIYTEKAEEYHDMIKNEEKKVKMLYGDELIDIRRIHLPLFLFQNQNHLPVRKTMMRGKSFYLAVTMAPYKNIFKNKIKEIPLLNICLLANFINFKLKNDLPIYHYQRLHTRTIPIQPGPHPIYDMVILPLDQFGLIKDFYFTIIQKDDLITDRFGVFSDDLIEMEILHVPNNKDLLLHSKLDSMMLNQYIPLKKLGHRLSCGIYYYTFSKDPRQNKMLGGLYGTNYLLRLKIKKIEGVVKFYLHEYSQEIF